MICPLYNIPCHYCNDLGECVGTCMVDCQWTFNFLKMEKSLVREDTGEIVTTEKLTDTERQLALKTEYDFKLPLSEQGGKEATA